MFAECGMEVYETVSAVRVEVEGPRHDVERTNTVLRVRARFEQVQQQLYAMYELMNQLNLDASEQSERMEEWENHVHEPLDRLTSLQPEVLVSKNRPWEL